MAELLAYLARELVDDPEAVRVETEERDGALVLLLHVAPDDVGKVIARRPDRARAADGRPCECRSRGPPRPRRNRRVRVAALYDVHGMPWTLEAVLGEVRETDVLLFGGDLLHGPDPARTVALAREAGQVFVRGNCEREPKEWDRARLGEDDLAWLASLPLTQTVDGVLYCHATPRDDMPMTTVFTPDEVIAERFGGLVEHVFVIGHTHHQFDRSVGDVRVVNAGSVGMAYEDDVAAYWLEVDDGEPRFRRTV